MLVTTVLSLAMLGQADLPGSKTDLDQAVKKARVVVVAELETFNLIFGSGACAFLGGGRLKTSDFLMGDLKDGEKNGLSITALGPERLPKMREDCIYFIDDFAGHLNTVKVLPKTEENLQAVRKAIKAKKKP